MNTLEMNGPADLNAMKISEAIKAKSPGNYALGILTNIPLWYNMLGGLTATYTIA